ncbi:MAG: hypothetical protein ACO3EY_06280 [Candidatus Nanopelagicales bacterium]
MQETKKMMKSKHNKKRNTAFLYEIIVREITNSILEKNEQNKSFLINVCKAFFSNNSILKKELELYKAINEAHEMSSNLADKLLNEAKTQYNLLDKNKIFNEQTKLINILNKYSNGKIFNTFVPDYKNLATISQIFNNTTTIKEKVLLENQIVTKMSSSPEEVEKEKMETLDSLAYKVFVRKFNEQYGNSLLKEQKDLLTKYVMSFADNGIEFKIFLNEEIQRLKDNLKQSLNNKEIIENSFLKEKTNVVLKKVEEYKNKTIDQQMVQEILKIQSLIKEINSEETSKNG